MENKRLSVNDVIEILSKINFAEYSCIDMNYKFEVKEVKGQDDVEDMYLIRTSFQRKDIVTGEFGTGWGRWHTTPINTATETSIVMTAWVCVKMIVEHELMEGFLYSNARVFNPHKSVDELVYPNIIKRY